MKKFYLYIQLLRNMGMRYFLFRCQYELRRRSGVLKIKYPVFLENEAYLSLDDWRKCVIPFLFSDRKDVVIKDVNITSLSERVRRMQDGEYCFFSSLWYNLGKDYDWLTNPDTNYKYNVSKHWTEIEDFIPEIGDIKYVWEKSRFSFLYDIIRYDQKTGKSHASFVFTQIIDWIHQNPLNCGPNYKCSQEISLRILNWVFALYYYRTDKALTEEVFDLLIRSIYGQMKHVRSNINFSRIAVRTNQAITETLTLYLIGLLFPQFPDAKEWKEKGKKWFEEEIKYQIAEDGTFLQFSMNYHRVVVQLLTLAIAVADNNGELFCKEVYERSYQSLNFLYQCQDELSGYLPNYGANDGALFFRLNDCDYRDYRPQLDALHFLLTKQNLYAITFEDRDWFYNRKNLKRCLYPKIERKQGNVTFKNGGYYIIREKDVLTFIRCGKYKERPSQADNLHIDIWYKGENILLDGGSYKYNTEKKYIKYFMGTESHNTIMLDNLDQMLKGERFVWYNWSQALDASLYETEISYIFEGKVACFSYLGKDIIHYRKLIKRKNELVWICVDIIEHKPNAMFMRQLWHTNCKNLDINAEGLNYSIKENYCANYYGIKEKCNEIVIQTKDNEIKTTIRLI